MGNPRQRHRYHPPKPEPMPLLSVLLFTLLTLLPLATAQTDYRTIPPATDDSSRLVPNEYIVIYADSVTDATVMTHETWLRVATTEDDSSRLTEDPAFRSYPRIPSYSGFAYKRRWNHTLFRGYSAQVSSEIAEELMNLPEVAFVEQAARVYALERQANVPSWGLARISQKDLPLGTVYDYPSPAGENVNVYVLDTGCNILHPDFQGRAVYGERQASSNNNDLQGHGTHVTGTVGSFTYGVAKKATLISVKVLGDDGSGSSSSVVSGIAWASKDARAKNRRCVINLSLGMSGNSASMTLAVRSAVSSNCLVVVAAGNDGQNACATSPANIPEAFTVGATDRNDALASFSNWGPCVDILAPGTGIVSTSKSGSFQTMSGTSMATPFVSGLAAVIISNGNFPTVKTVQTELLRLATRISNIRADTTNLLVQVPSQFNANNPVPAPAPSPSPVSPSPSPSPSPRQRTAAFTASTARAVNSLLSGPASPSPEVSRGAGNGSRSDAGAWNSLSSSVAVTNGTASANATSTTSTTSAASGRVGGGMLAIVLPAVCVGALLMTGLF
ncbi:Transcriptional coactivator [Phlyctochytrium bullatum]|nr:Transcriptional coactivator [Phlyctochytrium bullatum]